MVPVVGNLCPLLFFSWVLGILYVCTDMEREIQCIRYKENRDDGTQSRDGRIERSGERGMQKPPQLLLVDVVLAGNLHGAVAVETPVAHALADNVPLRVVHVQKHLPPLHHERPLALRRDLQTRRIEASGLGLAVAETAGVAELALVGRPRRPPAWRQRREARHALLRPGRVCLVCRRAVVVRVGGRVAVQLGNGQLGLHGSHGEDGRLGKIERPVGPIGSIGGGADRARVVGREQQAVRLGDVRLRLLDNGAAFGRSFDRRWYFSSLDTFAR